MSDYPMLISNKLHSFRNFTLQNYKKTDTAVCASFVFSKSIPNCIVFDDNLLSSPNKSQCRNNEQNISF